MRIAIIGGTGSGQIRLGRRAARRLGAPFYGITHAAKSHSDQELRDALDASDAWVAHGSYADKSGYVACELATTIVLFDLPLGTVVSEALKRRANRMDRGSFDPHRERKYSEAVNDDDVIVPALAGLLLGGDAEENPIQAAWANQPRFRRRYHDRASSGEWSHAEVMTLRSHSDAERWVRGLATG